MAEPYYWRDFWYFARGPHGSVNIYRKLDSDTEPSITLPAIPASEWASIVAHVSAIGDTQAQHFRADLVHNGVES
jgi:hypothetical protein